MNKKINLFAVFLLCISCLQAQSFRLRDITTGKIITSDTVLIQSKYNGGWVGYESLDLLIAVENISNKTIETGAKKIEYEILPNSVSHTFCFAGNCFPTTVYVSPLHANISQGLSDSGFIAHYLFDNTIHIRGINHVAYVFYDVSSPNDSVFVNVTYKTVISNAGVKEQSIENKNFSLYPNPANDEIFIDRNFELKNVSLTINNVMGETIKTILFPPSKKVISFNATELPSGIYFVSFFENNELKGIKKILVNH